MSKDWVQIIGCILYIKESLLPRVDCKSTNNFLPLSRALSIQRFDADDADFYSFLLEATNDVKNRGAASEAKKKILDRHIAISKTAADFFPLYFMLTDNVLGVYPQQIDESTYKGTIWCLIHPAERDRMERHLTGTVNPIHDLVHEMRYNPALAVGAEVQTAKMGFENLVQKE